MYNLKFKIVNLTCEACVKLSVSSLKKIPGMINADVDFQSGETRITAHKNISWQEIVKSLSLIGKEAKLI